MAVAAAFVYSTLCWISVLIIMNASADSLLYPVILAVAIIVTSIMAVQRSFKTIIIDCIRCE